MKKTSLLMIFAAASATFLGGCDTTPKTKHFQYTAKDCTVLIGSMKGESKNLVREYDFALKTLNVWRVVDDKGSLSAEFVHRNKPFSNFTDNERAEATRLGQALPAGCIK